MPFLPVEDQTHLLLEMLKHTKSNPKDPAALEIARWIRDMKPEERAPALLPAFVKAYGLSPLEIEKLLEVKHVPTNEFDMLVPNGFYSDYIEFTKNTEPPTVFHFAAALAIVGATMARNTFFDKGGYRVFPNICIVIIAPTGKCRKTSACNVAVGLARAVAATTILADKLTPEALVEAFRERAQACGLIYAPELAVFLGKQKYQEGMVPMLTALFDCPDEWTSATIGRGDLKLTNVALSFLGCSTIDWMQTAIPKDAFGGGFMSRFLYVVQEDTPRKFALPPPMDKALKGRLLKRILDIQKLRGEWKLTDDARKWYIHWYNTLDSDTDNVQFSGYWQRKPDHLLRVAMCIAAGDTTMLTLEQRHLEHALAILNWMERALPSTFETMQQTAIGGESQRLLHQLAKAGGNLDHSSFLRRNTKRMNARGFKEALETLRDAQLLRYDAPTKKYWLTPEGWRTVRAND